MSEKYTVNFLHDELVITFTILQNYHMFSKNAGMENDEYLIEKTLKGVIDKLNAAYDLSKKVK